MNRFPFFVILHYILQKQTMNLKELILKNRSYRRFDESYFIGSGTLESLIDLARLSASGANRQPLKYMICNTPSECERIFPSLIWAAYLKEWAGPAKGERPSGYIIILGDKSISEVFGVDHGIAAQSIMLGATEAGLGGCMIASIKREELRKELKIVEKFDILLVLALGKPVEKVIIDHIKEGDVKYWRDDEKNHHVPKRDLDEIIIK
jgi:nitroreductase